MMKLTPINGLYNFAKSVGHNPTRISDDIFKVQMSTQDVDYEVSIKKSNNLISYSTPIFSIDRFQLSTKQYAEFLENMIKIASDANIRLELIEDTKLGKRIFIKNEFLISESDDLEDHIEHYTYSLGGFSYFFEYYYESLLLDLHKVS